MTARKLNKTNPVDLLKAALYAGCAEIIHTETSALNPDEYAGYTAASMIPDLNDTDWEVIYEAVNEAVEKAAQGDPDPEDVMLFEIPGSPHLVVIELFGYVPTDPARNQGWWTGMRAHLLASFEE
jgi:hypothetical protein